MTASNANISEFTGITGSGDGAILNQVYHSPISGNMIMLVVIVAVAGFFLLRKGKL